MKINSKLRHFYENEFVNNKFSYLFLTIILYLTLEPFLGNKFPIMFSFFFILVIVTVLKALELKKRMFKICQVTAISAFICNCLIETSAISANQQLYLSLLLVLNLMYLFFIALAIVLLIKGLFEEKNVTSQTIHGGIAVYFLMGIMWALLYSLVSLFNSGAFAIQHDSNDFSQFVYFSFVTLTTLGYGDITPVTSVARNMAILEALIGQIFLTVFVARLVGMHIATELKK